MEAKLIELTGQLVAAYVTKNVVPVSDLPTLMEL